MPRARPAPLARLQTPARNAVLRDAETLLKAHGHKGTVHYVNAEGWCDEVLWETPEGERRTAFVNRAPEKPHAITMTIESGWFVV